MTKMGRPKIPFEAYIQRTPTCWLWTGNMGHDGYTLFRIGDRRIVASRVAHEIYKGPIPDGLVIDHLCRVHHCVNPDHLEAVPQKENVRRGRLGILKTHCIRGHIYTNTYRTPKGKRMCRLCMRDASRRFKERKVNV